MRVMTMEQQKIAQKTAPEQEHSREQVTWRSDFPGGGWAARALLAGANIRDLPHQSLAELAQSVGNSEMLALAAMRSSQAQLVPAELSGAEPQTAAFEVPQTDCLLSPAANLTGGTWPSAAFDPAGLA